MPKLMNKDPMQTHQTLHSYTFSAVDMNNLGSSAYTIVSIVQDVSSSVSHVKDDMEKTLKQILDACKKSPRSEQLLLRLVTFNSHLTEIHGFRELRSIDPSEYDGALNCNGMTALIDGCLDSIEATSTYGKQLASMDYECNAVIFVITDGMENDSVKVTDPVEIQKAIQKVRLDESLESMTTVLIAANDDPGVLQYLDEFNQKAQFDQFVKMGEASPAKLAKLADFISKSISSTSQALGTGSASQPLTF